jgi:hypothetical protein
MRTDRHTERVKLLGTFLKLFVTNEPKRWIRQQFSFCISKDIRPKTVQNNRVYDGSLWVSRGLAFRCETFLLCTSQWTDHLFQSFHEREHNMWNYNNMLIWVAVHFNCILIMQTQPRPKFMFICWRSRTKTTPTVAWRGFMLHVVCIRRIPHTVASTWFHTFVYMIKVIRYTMYSHTYI